MMKHEILQLSDEIEVSHIGPAFEEGRLPSVFYFALSGQESLLLDPFNQPAVYLEKHRVRVFSLDLPFHGPNLSALDAIDSWARAFSEGKDPITPFINQVLSAIDELIERGLIVREKIGCMGLSRGGLIAAHVAAKFTDIKAIVSFAPMTDLCFAREFSALKEEKHIQKLSTINLVNELYDLPIRFYMGNRDMRTSTEKCFQLVQKLADTAFEKGVRSPPIELILTPSIGNLGHGTSKEAFEAGADWLGKKIGGIR